MALLTHTLGFPRIGALRELKIATENFWKGKITESDLQAAAYTIRRNNWLLQREHGIELIPSNDFSFYDQVLDTIALFGAVPDRYDWNGGIVDFHTYFAMARGIQEKESSNKVQVNALEMLKWFDSNYHYLVPEFLPNTKFSISSTKVFDEFVEALSLGIRTKPVLIGPFTFLRLGKSKVEFDKLSLLSRLAPIFTEIIRKLSDLGAEWIQIDEPVLVLDLTPSEIKAMKTFYEELRSTVKGFTNPVKLLLATYFDDLGDNLQFATDLAVDAIHVDLTRGETDVVKLANAVKVSSFPKVLSLGVINGRNVWKARFEEAVLATNIATKILGANGVWLGTSCSLIHCPISAANENAIPAFLRSVLSFTTEKLRELVSLKNAFLNGTETELLEINKTAWNSFLSRPELNNAQVHNQIASFGTKDFRRASSFQIRSKIQQESLRLPILPTTTIGSLPQTAEARSKRLQNRAGTLSDEEYNRFISEKISEGIRFQEELDIDVPVHGEFERNDMVEFFGERLAGFSFTGNGWVQSFGSRYVKPPIIYGDVSRTSPMTIKETAYAQSLTSRPVKGMLTGPITILQWSFVREDQPRKDTALQIAAAIKEEVLDLEKIGIKIIQVDEPGLREGLPLKKVRWNNYLEWSGRAFRLSVGDVKDATQIHTHMCYAEFSDIIQCIADLDADVISIESSRSQMKLLRETFANNHFTYPNAIGPGIFDIHSPRIPSVEEMVGFLKEASRVVDIERLWVNPDCGLKTRTWPEVQSQLKNMVAAAKTCRATQV